MREKKKKTRNHDFQQRIFFQNETRRKILSFWLDVCRQFSKNKNKSLIFPSSNALSHTHTHTRAGACECYLVTSLAGERRKKEKEREERKIAHKCERAPPRRKRRGRGENVLFIFIENNEMNNKRARGRKRGKCQ